jgi:hypothetical protein
MHDIRQREKKDKKKAVIGKTTTGRASKSV